MCTRCYLFDTPGIHSFHTTSLARFPHVFMMASCKVEQACITTQHDPFFFVPVCLVPTGSE